MPGLSDEVVIEGEACGSSGKGDPNPKNGVLDGTPTEEGTPHGGIHCWSEGSTVDTEGPWCPPLNAFSMGGGGGLTDVRMAEVLPAAYDVWGIIAERPALCTFLRLEGCFIYEPGWRRK